MRAPVPCIKGFRRIFSRSDKRSVMSLDVRIHRFTGRRDEGMFAKVRRGPAADDELLFANRRGDWS